MWNVLWNTIDLKLCKIKDAFLCSFSAVGHCASPSYTALPTQPLHISYHYSALTLVTRKIFFYKMISAFRLQTKRDYCESVSGYVQIKGKKTQSIQLFPNNSPGNSIVSWILSKHTSFWMYNIQENATPE